jgi:DNA polymerase-3 subunit alpha
MSTRKYGRENVAQIITFGTMATKAAIKDVGRAMEIPYADVDRIVKMVPAVLNITIDQAIKDSPQLQQVYENDTQIRTMIDTAKKLERSGAQRRGPCGRRRDCAPNRSLN